MREDEAPWREVVVLVQAEFDVLEMVRSGGLRLYDPRCSAIAVKAASDLVARGFLITDGQGKCWITDFGDAVSATIGGFIILMAAHLGVPRVVLARMLVNLGADALTGAVPVVGDVVDAAWRANARNVALMEAALLEPQATRRRSFWTLAGLAVVVFALAVGGIALTFFVARAIWQAVS